MIYTIKKSNRAVNFIRTQPLVQRKRISAGIDKLPQSGDIKKMKGVSPDTYRLRIGNYRIIYSIDHAQHEIFVLNADNRGDIY